jgi:purine nucleosidase
MTVADWWGVTNKEPNALFIGNLNSEKFFDMLTSRISKLP